MTNSFYVKFSDSKKFKIHDIIHFTKEQIDEITAIALDYTMEQLRSIEDEGIDINISLNKKM